MTLREPTTSELSLLLAPARQAPELPPGWSEGLKVAEMEDGGMGSLRLVPRGLELAARRFGSLLAELQFRDADGVEVLASLNADETGVPFELDIWKSDFSKLIRLPDLDA